MVNAEPPSYMVIFDDRMLMGLSRYLRMLVHNA
jgi:hypothetical protein